MNARFYLIAFVRFCFFMQWVVHAEWPFFLKSQINPNCPIWNALRFFLKSGPWGPQPMHYFYLLSRPHYPLIQKRTWSIRTQGRGRGTGIVNANDFRLSSPKQVSPLKEIDSSTKPLPWSCHYHNMSLVCLNKAHISIYVFSLVKLFR